MRLVAGIDILWRAHGQSQVGADPRIGVVLEGLSAPEQRALEAVPRSRTAEDFRRFAMVSGVPRRRADELLSLLGGSGVLTESEPGEPGVAAGTRPDATTGDAQWRERRTLVGAPAGPGPEGDDALREAIVVVAGLGRTGALTAAGLAAAGVGTIQLSDPAPVRPVDLLPYGAADVGHPRAERMASQLHRAAPDVRLTAPARTTPDLVVHVTHRVVDPPRLRRLMQDDIPHLLVVVGELSTAVGPLVTPGLGPCSRCLDMSRADADPAWPAVATQLRVLSEGAESHVQASWAASHAVRATLAHLRGRHAPGALARASYELDPAGEEVGRRWEVHPRCGCSTAAGATRRRDHG